MPGRDVKIVVVGDSCSGKTSLITTIVSHSFQERVPSVVPPVTIFGANKVGSTVIVDTSSKPDDQNDVDNEIDTADVICLVYDIRNDDNETLTNWMKRITNISQVPVILVGSKCDLEFISNKESITDLVDVYNQIEYVFECSARYKKNIETLFLYAQGSVLYPMHTVWDRQGNCFSEEAINVFTRLYQLHKKSNSDILSNEEFLDFLKINYNLTESIKTIKRNIRRECVRGVVNEGITLRGFITFHEMMMNQNTSDCLESLWKVFRRYGYNDQLFLCESYYTSTVSEYIELDNAAEDFLLRRFDLYDSNNSGYLDDQEMENYFQIYPYGKNPFTSYGYPYCCSYIEEVGISKIAYIHLWKMFLHMDPASMLKCLSYIGFQNDTGLTIRSAYKIIESPEKRSVFNGIVIGSNECGKSTFCRKLFAENSSDTCNSLYYVGNTPTNKIVILQEENYLRDNIDNFEEGLYNRCDFVFLLYDQSNRYSFEFISDIYEHIKVARDIPCVVVKTKNDLPEIEQTMSPKTFTKSNRLPIIPANEVDVIEKLVNLAINKKRWPIKRIIGTTLLFGCAYAFYYMDGMDHLGDFYKDLMDDY
eukprot:TRINITY_DN97_c0_g1_i4.p1 TRINITY_DN97_c0_g1~~TRINITY_DN97_c0_g1_i4.p1  ORF type:complete len:591 (+),score=99.90 TRINITY_DN97_c0_g1_i4:47-1819(+)